MTVGTTQTSIATWFVADKPGEETSFPQVGGMSSSTGFQDIYWRCVTCFFNSSLRYNVGAHHLFFTNTDIPIVDGVNLADLFLSLGIQIIHLPITFRLPSGQANSWGNQFYILDIIKYVAANKCQDNLIVLDCDCVWTMTAEPISEAISRHGCLTYTLNGEHHPWDASINGATRQEMATTLHRWTSARGIDAPVSVQNAPCIHYHGGELFAATKQVCCDLAVLTESLWCWWLEAGSGGRGIKEEAHFLSILYASQSYSNYTANVFIKRIWTTFRVRNSKQSDCDLAIWHLPAEKKTGFRRLFREITGRRREAWAAAPEQDYKKMLGRILGIPRRGPKKLFLDICQKSTERARGIFKFD